MNGKFDGSAITKDGNLVVNGVVIHLLAVRNSSQIPWGKAGATYVCESTGVFTTTEKTKAHIEGGCKKVVISAPPKDATQGRHPHVRDEREPQGVRRLGARGVKRFAQEQQPGAVGQGDQRQVWHRVGFDDDRARDFGDTGAVDCPREGGKDWRGGRGYDQNTIPSSTGAAKAVGKLLPVLKGKLEGMAFRVPTPDVSMVDLTCRLHNTAFMDTIKATMKAASEGELTAMLGYTEDQVDDKHSSTFDADGCVAFNDKFVRLVEWYDNEWGYANRLVDLVLHIATVYY